MSKHRAYAVKIRKQRAKRRRCIVSVFSILAAFYKSIQIQKGDTLQGLADTYAKDSDKKTIARYIKEVKKLNGMWLNDLCAGDYLLIIYYDSVPEVM